MGAFKMELSGDKNVMRMFQDLPKAAQNRVLKPLVKQGGTMIAEEEKDEAPTATGLMKLALGTSPLRTYKTSLLMAVGVRRGFRRAVQGSKYFGKKKTTANPTLPVQNPVKYLHIIAHGRKAISVVNKKALYDARTGKFFGKHVAAAAPNDFIERAYDRAKTTVAETIASQASEGILAEAQSLLNKG